MTTLSIKPVSKGYFTRSSITLRDIAVKRRSGVAFLADRKNPDGTVTRAWLIPEPARFLTRGKSYEAIHADTGRKYGPHTMVEVAKFKFVGGILQVNGFEPGTRAYSELMDETAVAFQLI